MNRDKSQSVVFAFIHSTQEGRGFPALEAERSRPGGRIRVDSHRGQSAAKETPAIRQRRMVDESRSRYQMKISGETFRPRPSASTRNSHARRNEVRHEKPLLIPGGALRSRRDRFFDRPVVDTAATKDQPKEMDGDIKLLESCAPSQLANYFV